MKRLCIILFLICLIGVYASITVSRYSQLERGWESYRSAYYLDDVPMVTTVDAFRWVHYAEDLLDGKYDTAEKDALMYYPDGAERLKPFPLLSFFLILVSEIKGVNFFEAGIRLIPFLAGLFAIPLAFFFYRLGYPSAGLLGGITGGFSATYFNRSTAGRIDTDSLNLFFLFFTPLLILLAAERKKKEHLFVFAALAGLSQLLFQFWYHHAMFILIFLFIFALTLFLYKHPPRLIAISSAVYLLFSGPMYIYDGIRHLIDLVIFYMFTPEEQAGGYPNVYHTVTEASKLGIGEVLKNLFVNPAVAVFAFALLALMAYRLNKKVVPLAPIFLIGLMAFVSSNRFVMFLAPFMGIAYGFLVDTLVRLIPEDKKFSLILKNSAGFIVSAVLVLLLLQPAKVAGLRAEFHAAIPPSIPTPLYSTFNILRDFLPKDSAIYTWWDFGLAIEAQARLATFHDGLSQNTPKTWLIARSYLLDQERMSKNIAYIANNGVDELKEISLKEAENIVDSYDTPLKKENVYLFFTEDMIAKFGAIHYIGSWDNKTLQADPSIRQFRCREAATGEVDCGSIKIMKSVGLIYTNDPNNKAPIPVKTIAELEGGALQSERVTDFPNGYYTVLAATGGSVKAAYIMGENAYKSSFVQLFILGKADGDKFEEVVNLFPLMRLFKVKSYGAVAED
jgi:dolichyl-diphosphooligosaccharide--protein glycosyltransferase